MLANIKKAKNAMKTHPKGSKAYEHAKEYLAKAQKQYNIQGIGATIGKNGLNDRNIQTPAT